MEDKIIVAFESPASCQRICSILESEGLAECLSLCSAGEVKRAIRQNRVSLIVSGFKLRDASAEQLFDDLPDSSILLVLAPPAYLEFLHEDIFRLAAPVSRGDLCASVRMLLQVSHRLNRRMPQRSDQDQALVGQAKTLLMERNGMTEEEAHRYIQKQSMNAGKRMAQTAKEILEDI